MFWSRKRDQRVQRLLAQRQKHHFHGKMKQKQLCAKNLTGHHNNLTATYLSSTLLRRLAVQFQSSVQVTFEEAPTSQILQFNTKHR